jgi:hypothetical protein
MELNGNKGEYHRFFGLNCFRVIDCSVHFSEFLIFFELVTLHSLYSSSLKILLKLRS